MFNRADRLVLSAFPNGWFLLELAGSEQGNPFFHFEAKIAAAGDTHLTARALLNGQATVFLTSDTQERPVHGMITDVVETKNARYDDVLFHLTLRPRIWKMRTGAVKPISSTSRDLTVREILSQKLAAHGFNEGEDFVFQLQGRSRRRQAGHLTQNGNDLDYMIQLCERAGLHLDFDHCQRDCLVISDSTA
jgi:uncharacterized protein involved in type VI secretion and phage assembly